MLAEVPLGTVDPSPNGTTLRRNSEAPSASRLRKKCRTP